MPTYDVAFLTDSHPVAGRLLRTHRPVELNEGRFITWLVSIFDRRCGCSAIAGKSRSRYFAPVKMVADRLPNYHVAFRHVLRR